MSYLEIVQRALKGRSVNAAAKLWGVPQSTLDKYARGVRLPDYLTAKIIATEAGITAGEMLDTLAAEEAKRRLEIEQRSFNPLVAGSNPARPTTNKQ
jgi:hypothetical protein